jgi:hypothetical protein
MTTEGIIILTFLVVCMAALWWVDKLEQNMFKNKNIMDQVECNAHADRIRAMADFSELVALCRVDERFALFCGVKPTDSEFVINMAREQWDVCRKKKP